MKYFTTEELDKLLNDALSIHDSEKDYVAFFVKNIAKVLKKKPLRYRYFGQYWYALKQVMINDGQDWLDGFIDLEAVEKVNLPDEYVCVAAWVAESQRISQMEVPMNSFFIDTGEDTEEGVLVDGFMEQLALI